MENSIEKDIHLLESYAGMTHKMNDNQGRPKLDQAIEHILQDYKRVLKENEELNLKYYMLYTGKIENLKAQEVKIKSQVIPVQKVKDKIEELDNQQKQWLEDRELKASNREIIFARDVLQELLVSN